MVVGKKQNFDVKGDGNFQEREKENDNRNVVVKRFFQNGRFVTTDGDQSDSTFRRIKSCSQFESLES